MCDEAEATYLHQISHREWAAAEIFQALPEFAGTPVDQYRLLLLLSQGLGDSAFEELHNVGQSLSWEMICSTKAGRMIPSSGPISLAR